MTDRKFKKIVTPKRTFIVAIAVFVLSSFMYPDKPVLYIIGDSTVRNTNRPQCGWGEVIGEYFDSTKIRISNQAMAGRSTRTFIKEGRWDKVLSAIKPGDFLMVQFGHNEGSRPDTSKAGYRGVLKGTGEDTVHLTWPDGKPETVNTYGWYLRKFIREAKEKGASVIICSMIPRNEFRDGKVMRADKDYGKWAREVAQEETAFFVDLNNITADKYDKLGPEEVKKFFPGDHTHTNEEGAGVNAASIAEGIKAIKNCALNNYLIPGK
jgi:rhamnogalacturonan acetylesterase